MPSRITTTSYGLLSLLAVRPWSAYEITAQMQRSLRFMCPRAESNVYAGLKTVVQHGMAKASTEPAGQTRTRQIYTITTAGRLELRQWLSTPGAGPSVEFEGLLKTCFSENGTREDLLGTLDAARIWAENALAIGEVVSLQAASAAPPYPERLPQILLTNTFLMDYIDLVRRWAQWATEVVQGWDCWPPATVDTTLLDAAAALRLPLFTSDPTPRHDPRPRR